MINYQIILCYKLIFNIENYFYNFGFYASLCIILLIIILLFSYCFVGKKSIKLEYLKNGPNLKEIKKQELEFDINKKKLDIEGNKDSKINERNILRKKSKKAKSHIINKKNILKEFSNPLKKKTREKIKSITIRKRKTNTMIVKNNIKLNIAVYKESKSKMIDKKDDNNNNKGKKTYYLKTNSLYENNSIIKINTNFNDLTYEKAIEKDKRNILRIFISLFNIKLEIIQIIFYPRKFSHKSLTFSLYLFDLLLDLTINSLLFSDDVISQKYYNNGELKFFTANMLSITSNIISNFILYLTGKLINYYDILETITHEVKSKKNFYKIFFKLSFFIELKIIIFYLVLFLLGLFCTYYLFIFCCIYKKIQKNLFINYILGSLWSLGFTIAICLIITLLRKIAIKKRIKRLYIISKFIDDKF